MSTLAPRIEVKPAVMAASSARRFHIEMACATLFFLTIAAAGSWLVSVHVEDIGINAARIFLLFPLLALIPAYLHDKQRWELRDSVMTLPWLWTIGLLIPFPFIIGARLRMPLQDKLLARIDGLLGVSVPGIMTWATRHDLNAIFNTAYSMVVPLLFVTMWAPVLAGKVRHAQEYVLANVIVLAIGSLLFALFPAIGPWTHYHTAANPQQIYIQSQMLALRRPGPYSLPPVGIVCFPSFHTVWAVLCAAALWGFRSLRVPVTLLSAMIIVSTLTTGWHYFTDVLAGLILAFGAIVVAKYVVRYNSTQG